ncbi:MAG TPA: NADH:flavin oxidoreductase, partial [Thermoleophilia bacterium]|nr:NADH:flavin oxidoreductase [Thermoleophilia bacterium]
MKLFEPIRIGAMEVPNRIVFPPIGSQLAEQGGTVGDTTINYYARRAEGGAGLVIVEYTAVDDRRYSSHRQLRLSNDSFIPGMRRLAAAIK